MNFRKLFKISSFIIFTFLIILAVIFMFFKLFAKPVDKNGMINHRAHEITGVEYWRGAGKLGDELYMSILPDENGKLIYTIEYNYNYAAPTQIFTCEVAEDALDGIKQICEESNCLIAGEGRPQKDVVLDGYMENVTFILENGQVVLENSNDYKVDCYMVYYNVCNELKKFNKEIEHI